VDYLAACLSSGLPVTLGGIDYAKTHGAGTYGNWRSTARCMSSPVPKRQPPAAANGSNRIDRP
jgi:hypothetical protein